FFVEDVEELLPRDSLQLVFGASTGDVEPQKTGTLVVVGVADDSRHSIPFFSPASDFLVIDGQGVRHGTSFRVGRTGLPPHHRDKPYARRFIPCRPGYRGVSTRKEYFDG